jgi:hypothetical protein
MKKRLSIIISAFLILFAVYGSAIAESVIYYADATAADQGAAGTRTIKGLATAIGATKEATIVLSHNSSSTNTTYTVSTDLTLTSNITLKVDRGALISVATGKTLTVSGIFDAGCYVVKSGAGSLVVYRSVYPEWTGLSSSASGANNKTYLDNALDIVPSGGTMEFCGKGVSYPVAGQWTIDKAVTVDGYGTELDFSTDSNNQGIVVTASNVSILGLEIEGPDKSDLNTTQIGISATGVNNDPAAPTYISGLKIKDCKIHDFGRQGIVASYVENFDISHNEVYNHFYAGITIVSGKDGIIDNNNVHDIEGYSGGCGDTGCAYGISLSSAGTSSLTAYPQSVDILVSNNIIKNVPHWEGLDTHYGKRISFVNNKVYDTKIGITVGGGSSPYETSYNLIIGNSFISSLDLDVGSGITEGGSDGSNLSVSNTYSNNYIYGYYDGIVSNYNQNTKYIGNTVEQAKRYGFYGYADLVNVDISHNSFTNFEAGTGSGIILSAAGTATDSGRITDNYIDANGIDYGINTNNATAYTGIREYDNTVVNATKANIKYPGRLSFNIFTDNDSQATSGKGEDTIGGGIVSMPATGILKVHAAGTKTNANGNKTLKFYYGASTFTFVPAVNNVLDWTLDVTIVQTAASVQIVSWKSTQSDSTTAGNTLVLSGVEAWTEDTSSAITIKLTGECANDSDVITKKIFMLERVYE